MQTFGRMLSALRAALRRFRRAIALMAYPRLRQLEEELEAACAAVESANVDSLTGANNRNAYDRFLASDASKELHRVVIDLDHFKEINDTYGHLTGDQVLRLVGEYLRLICHYYELSVRQRLYRIGGDELVVFVEPEKVKVVAQSIDAMIAVSDRPLPEHDGLPPITASVGYGATFEEADEALYRIKGAR